MDVWERRRAMGVLGKEEGVGATGEVVRALVTDSRPGSGGGVGELAKRNGTRE